MTDFHEELKITQKDARVISTDIVHVHFVVSTRSFFTLNISSGCVLLLNLYRLLLAMAPELNSDHEASNEGSFNIGFVSILTYIIIRDMKSVTYADNYL